jgi:RhtB (resistance to homoserine/threonine) family protein
MSAFLTIALIHFLAVISPGPDFVIITRNSLVYSRKTGIFTAAGLGCGIVLHATYSLLGIGLVISKSILLFNTIKWIGALYLIYIGWKSLTAKHQKNIEADPAARSQKDLSAWQAFRTGFLCNALNPKATLFMLALFTQVIDPLTPLAVQIGYGLYMGAATFIWFSFVASVFSFKPIKAAFARIQESVERVMGAVLIALGIKVALSSGK